MTSISRSLTSGAAQTTMNEVPKLPQDKESNKRAHAVLDGEGEFRGGAIGCELKRTPGTVL